MEEKDLLEEASENLKKAVFVYIQALKSTETKHAVLAAFSGLSFDFLGFFPGT